MAKLLPLAFLLLYTFTHAAAVPASAIHKVYPEVRPGPGLPSLASIGLTSAELYEMTPNLSGKPEKRDKLFDPYCGGGNDATANVNDVIACFNYLQSIGGISCGIAGDGNQHHMCEAGTAIIAGVSVFGTFTETACMNVALGVQWVFTYCNTDGQVEGDAAAYGDGNMAVVRQLRIGLVEPALDPIILWR
ncbi:hypothetical protein MMC06_002717 [Schaereria dolodes]|nr:hypothetical protein [Schaereria dolodes]